jgi:squalene-hopene/tetraprenyl-beta-curcumene cyclase
MSAELEMRPAPTQDFRGDVERAMNAAAGALVAQQQPDGHWLYELEADATIPAEYVLLRHYRGEPVDAELERKIAVYLRRIQGAHGGWPLFRDGDFDMSATVKAYFALKTIGDGIGAPHMRRAREAILARGGAVHVNVFTRVLLALFGILSWGAVPMMPVEIVLLPQWFPFHLSKISYWGRTVLVPLLVLFALQPRAKNPRGITLDELFLAPPLGVGLAEKAPHQNRAIFAFFRAVDVALRLFFKRPPARLRQRAIACAVDFVSERLNGKDGLGAIFPAMANAVMMFDVLGGPENEKKAAIARDSVERLLVIKDNEAYCQPCLSPVWDTALAAQALLEVGSEEARAHARKGLDWLVPLQVLDVRGDWIARRPELRPGGWAFQYANPHYPDLDDTAVIVMAMDRERQSGAGAEYDQAIARATEWVKGMQSRNGGWAAFDVDNVYDYLNNIPFADHGALVDPPTEDVAARCVSMLAQLGETLDRPSLARGVRYLLSRQLAEGSWYGRWGLNYIYGTWSVLCALNAAGMPSSAPEIRKAVSWLVSIQNADGGWGEDGSSYRLDYRGHEPAASTASQTAWALLALMAAGEAHHPGVAGGVRYLMQTQDGDGLWSEERFTGTGFPRVFYLRYHGYRKYFPLWALARYRNLTAGNDVTVGWGM